MKSKKRALSVLVGFIVITSIACLVSLPYTIAATNIAQGKPATTDSAQAANPAGNGNDGNTTTRWCAANGNTGHWWQVDLGSSQGISGTEVMWEKSGVVYKYKVEVSPDNSSWSLMVDKTNNTNTAQTQTDNFTVAARYVRITITGLSTSPVAWASFYEFRVFGAGTSGTPTPTSRAAATPTPTRTTTPSPTPPPTTSVDIDIAFGRTASADSSQSGHAANLGNDGSTGTYWSANDANPNHWWKVDLSNSFTLTGAEVVWLNTGVVYKYKVEVSNDNSTWSMAADKTANTSTAQTQTVRFTTAARYARITVTGVPSGSNAAIYEFRVFGNETYGATKAAGSAPTVYIVGDSTVQTYSSSSAPQQGWGYYLPNYFTTNVAFLNKAIGGRSSKSFVFEGRLNEILRVIKTNDYLFIQMGHNDADSSKPERYTDPNTTYKQYLKIYIDAARERGAIPVLITPVCRLDYKNGVFVNDFPAYCTAMKEVASANNVPCIDLMTKSLNLLTSVGYDTAYTYYLVSSNGTDYTHFTTTGADQMAKLVAQGVREINVGISQYVK